MKYNELDTVIYIFVTLLFIAGAVVAFQRVMTPKTVTVTKMSQLKTQNGENFTEGVTAIRSLSVDAVCFNDDGFKTYVQEWKSVFGSKPVIAASTPQGNAFKLFAKEGNDGSRPYYVILENRTEDGERENCMLTRGENLNLSMQF